MLRTAFPSRRKLLPALALAAIVFGGVRWAVGPPREPVRDGQRLSEVAFGPKGWRASAYRNPAATSEQLRGYGSAGVRWLTWYVVHGDRPFVRRGALPLDHAPGWLRRWMPDRWGGLRTTVAVDEQLDAVVTLQWLGEEAAPTIPALVSRLESGDEVLRWSAAETLNGMGPVSWPAVHHALEHAGGPGRRVLLATMMQRLSIQKEPAPDREWRLVAEALRRGCADDFPEARSAAARMIGCCHYLRRDSTFFDPAIPEVIRLLSDPDPKVRQTAATAIRYLGEKATPAIPRLTKLGDDPSPEVRRNAAQSLNALQRLEAPKAGP